MCGISGILAFGDGFEVSAATVERMSDTIAHRGPDDCGAWHEPADRVALGHRRLAIVDLSPAGHQPMSNEDGSVWLAYNGEVYNHGVLREELERKGHRYRSETDSETLVHLWEEEGPRMVERLEGMFAFAIWDSRERALFLARDRLGVKPLYYGRLPGGLVFGSELKALLAHPAVVPELDEEAFHDYLTFAFTPPPRTMYAGLSKLAPAEWMLVHADGTTRRESYWTPFSPSVSEDLADASDAELTARLRDLLRESIRKRMMSDVPFGVFLSGGLDSSTNVALMAELTGQPVRTFSTAPRDHAEYDELVYAREVAALFGTDHHEVVVDDQDLMHFLPQLLFHQDEPTADWTSIPQHFVTKLARDNGVVVVQVGEGSDELFHGYKGYVDHRRVVVPFQRLPQMLQEGLSRTALSVTRRAGRGIRHGQALESAAASDIPYWGGFLCFRGSLKQEVLRNGSGPESLTRVEALWEEADRAGADLFQSMSYVELKQRLPELLLMRLDKITMASSVEGREPFLDHDVVEFAMALRADMKVRGGAKKHILKQAMTGVLPDHIIHRRKQGFGTPMPQWLRGDFGARAQRDVRESALRERGLLDYGRIDELFDAHRAGRGDWSAHLWNLHSVSTWYDRWVAKRPV